MKLLTSLFVVLALTVLSLAPKATSQNQDQEEAMGVQEKESNSTPQMRSEKKLKRQDRIRERYFEFDTFAYSLNESSQTTEYSSSEESTVRETDSKLSNLYASYLRLAFISRARSFRFGMRTYGANQAHIFYGWRFSSTEWGSLFKYTWNDRKTRGATGSKDELLHDIDFGLYGTFFRKLFGSDAEYHFSLGGLFSREESKSEGHISSSKAGPGYFITLSSRHLWSTKFWKKTNLRLLSSLEFNYKSISQSDSPNRSTVRRKQRHFEIVPLGIRTIF